MPLVVLGLAAVGPDASAAPGPNTSWAMTSDGDDPVLQGRSYGYGPDAGITVTDVGSGARYALMLQVQGWRLDVSTGDPSVPLEAGRTYQGGMALLGDGVGCQTSLGSFTVHEVSFDAAGQPLSVTLSFEEHCDDSPAHAYGSIAWHSDTPAPPLPATRPASPRLEMDAVPPAAYGDRVTVSGTLTTTAPTRQVSLFAQLGDRPEEPVATVPVGADGRWSARVRVTEKTRITARVAATGAYPAASVHRIVPVRASVRTYLFDGRRRVRGAGVFPVSAQPVVAAVVRPAHRGDCVRFRLELRVRGQWGHRVVTECLRLDAHSAAAVRVPGGPRLVGVPLRVRPLWAGDERNGAAQGAWAHLRFRR